MAQKNNNYSEWPKAFVAILGTASIATGAYYLHEPNIFWAMLLLIWIISFFD